ncbi:MAG: hypothetical protein WBB27_05640 [Maribacter sp.]
MKNTFYTFITLILLLFNGCNSDGNSMETDALFYWNQTKCADPWNTGENDSNDESEIAVKEYLESENVIIQNLGFDTNSPLDISCESCGCGTGQRIIIEVFNSDISKMKELDFYQ